MNSSTLPAPPRASGFTLMEVMIAIAVVGIITAIALPSYQEYSTRGKIPDAISNLSAKQLQIENWFADNRTYVGATACATDTNASKYFDFACTSATATAFQLNATGKGAMVGFTYSIDQNNVKTTVAVPTGWAVPTPNTCWVTRKGGVC